MQIKVKALLMAVVMIAVAGTALISTDDSDAATVDTDNIVKVYFKKDATTATKVETTYGYDLYQALKSVEYVNDANSKIGFKITVDDTDPNAMNSKWKQTIPGDYPYDNPNENYGTISTLKIGNSTTNSFDGYDVFVYNKEYAINSNTNATYGWHTAIDAIGWYHPFSDYSAYMMYPDTTDSDLDNTRHSLAAASIAIVPAGTTPDNTTCPDPLEPLDITKLSSINKNVRESKFDSRFIYEFEIETSEYVSQFPDVSVVIKEGQFFKKSTMTYSQTQASPVTIYGSGSNVYEAFKDAINAVNITAEEQYAKNMGGYFIYYTWLDTVLGNGTQTIPNADGTTTYHYWSSTIGGVYCDFTMGYYSNLAGAQNAAGVILLSYI